jgi:hypothetical protein
VRRLAHPLIRIRAPLHKQTLDASLYPSRQRFVDPVRKRGRDFGKLLVVT